MARKLLLRAELPLQQIALACLHRGRVRPQRRINQISKEGGSFGKRLGVASCPRPCFGWGGLRLQTKPNKERYTPMKTKLIPKHAEQRAAGNSVDQIAQRLANRKTPPTRDQQSAETGHTPGPWKSERVQHRYGCYGHEILPPYRGAMTMRNAPIAFITSDDEQDRANARLIAAAPELLEALKHALDFVPDLNNITLIRSAIAKAEGRAQ